MWHRKAKSFSDRGMLQNHIIDFPWRDLFSAPIYDFFKTARDEQITIFVEIPLVACPKPPPCECIVVGIQPDVAFSMVQLGLTLEGTTTALDLEDGLNALRERIGAEGNPL